MSRTLIHTKTMTPDGSVVKYIYETDGGQTEIEIEKTIPYDLDHYTVLIEPVVQWGKKKVGKKLVDSIVKVGIGFTAQGEGNDFTEPNITAFGKNLRVIVRQQLHYKQYVAIWDLVEATDEVIV